MTKACSVALAFTSALMLLGSVPGCGDSNLGRVTGTVTMDGKPLADAFVVFKPLTGARLAAAKTDKLGKYELVITRTSKGARIGQHVVEISTYDELMGEDATEVTPETVPARYNTKSELTANVKAGDNVINFALESGGEILEPTD
jgi:hypothetical protein